MSRPPHFLSPLVRGAPSGAGGMAPRYLLKNERTGMVVSTTIETAFDSKTRRRGLLGRAGLAEEAVLIIAPCDSVHTFFMRFPIDVVFADRQGKIVKISHNLPPWRVSLAFRAFATLEFAAGRAEASGLRMGDRFVIEPQ